MQILHIIPGLTVERGGPSTVVEALSRCQADLGHQVTVVTTDQGARRGERFLQLDERVAVHTFPVTGPDRIAFAPGWKRAAPSIINGQDIVHLHSIFTHPIHTALEAARRCGKPAILRPCGLLHPYSLRRSRWVKNAYLACWGRDVRDACSAWHHTSANESEHSWPNGNSRRFVLPNGMNPQQFDLTPNAARSIVAENWPQLADTRYVLFLGRLHPKKRVDLLLDAFLHGVPDQIKLVIAGPDECGLWPRLQRRFIRSASAAARIVRIDAVRGPRKAALLTAADLFALPSEHENFGIAALEALACGTPILISPHVDLAGTPFDKHYVTRVEIDGALWSAELQRLLQAPIPEPARRALRSQIANDFSWNRVATRLQDCYVWVQHGCIGSSPSFHSCESLSN